MARPIGCLAKSLGTGTLPLGQFVDGSLLLLAPAGYFTKRVVASAAPATNQTESLPSPICPQLSTARVSYEAELPKAISPA